MPLHLVLPPSIPGVVPTHDEIARVAFQIWMDTGEPAGSEHQNWLIAVAALLRDRGLPPDTPTW